MCEKRVLAKYVSLLHLASIPTAGGCSSQDMWRMVVKKWDNRDGGMAF